MKLFYIVSWCSCLCAASEIFAGDTYHVDFSKERPYLFEEQTTSGPKYYLMYYTAHGLKSYLITNEPITNSYPAVPVGATPAQPISASLTAQSTAAANNTSSIPNVLDRKERAAKLTRAAFLKFPFLDINTSCTLTRVRSDVQCDIRDFRKFYNDENLTRENGSYDWEKIWTYYFKGKLSLAKDKLPGNQVATLINDIYLCRPSIDSVSYENQISMYGELVNAVKKNASHLPLAKFSQKIIENLRDIARWKRTGEINNIKIYEPASSQSSILINTNTASTNNTENSEKTSADPNLALSIEKAFWQGPYLSASSLAARIRKEAEEKQIEDNIEITNTDVHNYHREKQFIDKSGDLDFSVIWPFWFENRTDPIQRRSLITNLLIDVNLVLEPKKQVIMFTELLKAMDKSWEATFFYKVIEDALELKKWEAASRYSLRELEDNG
ncbi:MAG TPA: hypothetical protein VEL47_03480 [Myxococcota bacterium]|nr:hypothetical protein [Myxococcota bacterium]